MRNSRETTQSNHQELFDRLKSMRLSGMAEELERQISNPNTDLLPFHERIERVVNAEWDLRFNKKFNRFLKKASLKYPAADFDDTLYDPARQIDTCTVERLSDCTWVEEGRNLIITGATGTGKSWLSNALCINALRQFKTVCYIRANILMNELEQALITDRYLDYINQIARQDMLVIDDFGLMQLDLDKCRNLFDVNDSRDCRKSTMIVSQFPVTALYDLFADNTYADACLDRMVHKAYRLQMDGKNMRNPTG
nr:ATP-binding protein [uncultured Clostridium sp.]